MKKLFEALRLLRWPVATIVMVLLLKDRIHIPAPEKFTDFAPLASPMAWPVAGLCIAIIFRKTIESLLLRIKNAKKGDLEVEFSELADSVEKLEAKVAPPISPAPPTSTADEKAQQGKAAEISSQLSRSPEAAFITVSREIERELFQYVASVGKRASNLPDAIRILMQHTGDYELSNSLNLFRQLRNTYLHKGFEKDEFQISRLVDMGISILQAIKAIPREINIVAQAEVDIFMDKDLQKKFSEKAVLLETTDTRGKKFFRIYPTTKKWYRPGMQVSWEWNDKARWGDAWYRVPKTGDVKEAWQSALEFVGRNIEDI